MSSITDSYAYGMLLNQTGATANPYLYRGEQYDADLSAYDLRARYYQPAAGRFLTTDPVEGFPKNPISLPRYVYANDHSISYVMNEKPASPRRGIRPSAVTSVPLLEAGLLRSQFRGEQNAPLVPRSAWNATIGRSASRTRRRAAGDRHSTRSVERELHSPASWKGQGWMIKKREDVNRNWHKYEIILSGVVRRLGGV